MAEDPKNKPKETSNTGSRFGDRQDDWRETFAFIAPDDTDEGTPTDEDDEDADE